MFSNSGSWCQALQRSSFAGPLFSPRGLLLTVISNPPRLSAITLIRRFADQDVRRLQFEFEDEFKNFIGGTTQPLPHSGGAGGVPKFLMTDGKKTLAVSNVSVQLSLNFGAALPSKLTLSDVLTRPAKEMDRALEKIFPSQKTFFSAIIVEWVATERDPTKVAALFNSLLLKPKFRGTLASLTATVGLEISDINRVIELSQFKSFMRAQQSGLPVQFSLDPDFDVADDEGVQIKVEVNTKPTVNSPPQQAFASLIPVLKETIAVDLPMFVEADFVAALPK